MPGRPPMTILGIVAVLLPLTALFAYANHRWLGLPPSIGVMLIALLSSLGLILLAAIGIPLEAAAEAWLRQINFDDTVLHGMLSFLLFAGALHVNINELVERKWVIGSLATVGTLLSTLLVGGMTWLVLGWLGMGLSLAYCLLFGALISPTDPIAVLGILRTAGAPRSLEMKIAGESLFNDGIGVVLFLVLAELAASGRPPDLGGVAALFLQEVAGGILLGLGLGYLTYRLLRDVDQHTVEVLLTLGLVTGGYALAQQLHVSGPIAIVAAGVFIGNHGRLLAMSEATRHHLDIFWEIVDEILNAVLFVLLGLEVLVLTFTGQYLLAGVLIIPAVLAGRLLAVGIPVTLLRPFQDFSPGAIRVMTWGGLRGGISVALALSLPPSSARDAILAITYAVVIFSIAVQGLTIGPMIRRMLGGKARVREREGV
jgi:CPA1 family monovalent cation:H+ antiporter